MYSQKKTPHTHTHTHTQQAPRVQSRRNVVVKADAGFLGSFENKVMATSVATFLAAGRFGLAPTSARVTGAATPMKLNDVKDMDIATGDPSGFNWVDVAALGSLGHIVGAAVILGLNGAGAA